MKFISWNVNIRIMKKLSVSLSALLLIAGLVAACGESNAQAPTSQPSTDVVGPCSQQFLPTITTMTFPHTSSQSIYFISGVHLYALNAGNGALRWCLHAGRADSRLATIGNASFPVIGGPPPPSDGLSAMTVEHGSIYVCSMDSYTYAFNASSGALRWKHQTGFANTSAPTIHNGVVYVGSGTIYALNQQDGTEVWHYPTPDVVTSSPVIVNGVVYLGSYGERVYALDAVSGSRNWEYPTGGRVYVDPVAGNGIVFFGAGNDGPSLYAVNAQNGKLLWHNAMLVNSTLTLANGVLYVGTNNYLYALNAKDGTTRWRQPLMTSLKTLVVNDILYVVLDSGDMYALNANDGTQRWHTPLRSMHAGSTTMPLIIHDELYVGTVDLGSSSPSNAMLHALNTNTGVEDWHASLAWNISTIGVAA
jgi:outer membrane protein assembly factor BamB